MIMYRCLPIAIVTFVAAALSVTAGNTADPKVVKPMQGLEASIDSIGGLEGGVRLIVPVQLKNTGTQYIALALVPPFPKASGSDGTTYFMQDVGGMTRCRNNNPIMGPACMGKPVTPGITIAPDAYTILDPGATANLDFHMTVERGNHRGVYATFSAAFAVRTFANENEDRDRTDDENYKRTRLLNVGFSEVRIVQSSSR
jgi:hypothetical protein